MASLWPGAADLGKTHRWRVLGNLGRPWQIFLKLAVFFITLFDFYMRNFKPKDGQITIP
jgi:hypothetical protein